MVWRPYLPSNVCPKSVDGPQSPQMGGGRRSPRPRGTGRCHCRSGGLDDVAPQAALTALSACRPGHFEGAARPWIQGHRVPRLFAHLLPIPPPIAIQMQANPVAPYRNARAAQPGLVKELP